MEFKQIEAFVNVIKYKGFTKAAEAVYLTQPTISTHISSLENELGVKLIERKGRECRATKQGRAFYNYAINIINTRDRAINAMFNFGTEISGTLDIKTSTIPGQSIVPEIIAKFHDKYPNVIFSVEQSDSEKVCNDILDNLGEIGFTGYAKNNEMKFEELFKDRMVVITPKSERFLKLREDSEFISIDDIANEKFIWREEGSATRKTFEDKYREKYGSDEAIDTIATVNSIEAVKQCVKSNLGISVLSRSVVSEDEKDFIIFEIADMDFSRTFYMVYNKNTTLSPVALKFREFVENNYIYK